MSAVRFFDTNILLYAYDRHDPIKREKALRLVEAGWRSREEVAISVQVLQEMYVNLERLGVSRALSGQIVRDFCDWPVVNNSVELFRLALDEQSRWQVSFWDALILAAARSSGASELITEDFNHGQDYDGTRAINPFR